jgi:hypothetical protein
LWNQTQLRWPRGQDVPQNPQSPFLVPHHSHFRNLGYRWFRRWNHRWRRRKGRMWARNGGGRRALRDYFISSQSACYTGFLFREERTGRNLEQGSICQGQPAQILPFLSHLTVAEAFCHSLYPPYSPACPEDPMSSLALAVSKGSA